MAGSTFGKAFSITTWGESHGAGVGVVVDGCPAGLEINAEEIQSELNRRKTGQSQMTTPRQEKDLIQIMSGVFEGKTTGTPISMLVYNEDADSSKYDEIKDKFRPGHADFSYLAKYGVRDHRGGGRSSARETVGRVAAGAIARKLLAHYGVKVVAYTKELGGIVAQKIDFDEIERNLVRCPDPDVAPQMVEIVLQAKKELDSLGGVAEVVAIGVPPGLGEPVFDKLDAEIAKAMLSIPAIKGIEFGAGFALARMHGSQSNDPFINVGGKIGTIENKAGGILGGISTGEDILVRLAVKPTSSIARQQNTVNTEGEATTIEVRGRHDPTIIVRAIPVIEAMLCLTLADHLMRQRLARLEFN
ncbi:MAG: chorismate synthase [Chloroflexi bacterium]|uniref:Chorismate synthase n=1 Tax=Candidatus Chlorohelix allophototropha TaxID=3003348 RepID=A0A8T7M875_9CHLR|nr:chorismate synthase [Chloroflexota bacterium]WJW68274.1 chorismate synthase [Chloroflexota bacterium L227-S17]